MPVKEALKEIEQLDSDNEFSYQKLATKHGCWHSTLTRQHKGKTVSHEAKAQNQRLMHPRDEAELVQYIKGLTEQHLMPTRQMI